MVFSIPLLLQYANYPRYEGLDLDVGFDKHETPSHPLFWLKLLCYI